MPEILPMLLEEMEFSDEAFDKYKNYIWQEKENGIRAMLHIKNGVVSALRSRRNKPILNLFPELKALDFGNLNAVLDGELVVFKDGKSVFYDGINQRGKLSKELLDEYPATFVAFDLLYLDGNIMINMPYEDRLEQLENNFVVFTSSAFVLTDAICNPKSYWYNVIIPQNREGLVAKSPNSKYFMNMRTFACIKMKNYKTAKVKVEQVFSNLKGVKITGSSKINGENISVQCQLAGVNSVSVGDFVEIDYLDIFNGKLIQPHKKKKEIGDKNVISVLDKSRGGI